MRMWTIDLGILLHHAESTLNLGPIQILKQNFGFTSAHGLVLFLMSKLSVITTFMESRFRSLLKVWVVMSKSSNIVTWMSYDTENQKIFLKKVAQECVQDQDKDEEHSQGERSEASIPIHQRVWEAVTVTAEPRETAGKTVFKAEFETQKRILKCGGRTCPPMNSVADTAEKPKSRNLSVNWYDMNIREKERQMEQFIGNSLEIQKSKAQIQILH